MQQNDSLADGYPYRGGHPALPRDIQVNSPARNPGWCADWEKRAELGETENTEADNLNRGVGGAARTAPSQPNAFSR